MARVKGSVTARKRHTRLHKAAKGYRGGRGRLVKAARETVHRGLVYAYRDRRVKKRDFRRLWIVRINAGCRQLGIPYNKFINGLIDNRVRLDRKILADLAVNDWETFSSLVALAQEEKVGAKRAGRS